MIKIYRLLRFKTKFLAFLLLFFVAAYVIAGRYALSILPDYREQIAHYLTEQIGHPVVIERISSKWIGFDPVLTFSGISINGDEQGNIGIVSARLATLRSILNLSPRFKSVQLIDSHLAIDHAAKGSIFVAGIGISGADSVTQDESGLQAALNLFDGAEIKLHNNKVVYTGIKKVNQPRKVRVWQLPSISMNYRGDEVFASGKVLQPDGDQPLLSFSLKGLGILSDDLVHGTVFLEARSSEFFDEVIKVYDWNELSVQDIDASSRIWIEFEGQAIKEITGDIQVSNLNWKIAEKSLPPVTNSAGRFNWFSRGDTHQLTLTGLGFDWAGHSCRSTDMLLNDSSAATLVYINQMQVDCFSELAIALGWLSPRLQYRLETSQPEGALEHLLFIQNKSSSENASSFTFEAELNEVSLNSFYSTPLGRGINGYIRADENGGGVYFQGKNFELGFPTLFLEPWKMSFAEGNVNWLIEGDDVEVFSDGIRLYFPDDSLVYGDFRLNLNPADREDNLYLSIAMQDLPISRATSFVPYHAVSEGLYGWLDRSLKSGHVTRGIYVGYGSTESDDAINNFTSSLLLETEQGRLSFAEGWPEIENLDSTIVVQNGELTIDADRANIQSTALNELSVFLPERDRSVNSDKIDPLLRARARVTAQKQDLDYWLRDSPISAQTSAVAEQIEIAGPVDVDIDLQIPVNGSADVGYDIHATLKNNTITHKDSSLVFNRVNGELLVSSSKGILAKEVSSTLLEQEASINIQQDFSKEWVTDIEYYFEGGKLLHTHTRVGHDVVIDLDTKLKTQSLLDHYQQEAIPGVQGEFEVAASLRIPADRERHTVLGIKSNLIGLERDWPEPLAKARENSENLWLDLILKPEQIHLHAGIEQPGVPITEMDALFMDQRLVFSDIRIGGAEAKNQISEGISISGKLNALELEPWQTFISSLNTGAENDTDAVLKQVELDVASLNAFGYNFPNVSSRITPVNDSWQIDLFGESVVGQVRLASSDAPLTLDFERLLIPDDSPESDLELNTIDENDTAERLTPKQLPSLSFSAKHLIYQGKDIGAWSTNVEPYDNGVYFRQIKGQLAENRFEGQIDWQGDDESSHSILTLNAKGGDIGKLISAFSLPETLSSDELWSDVALVWSGAPSDFELGKVSGKLELKLKDGVLHTSDKKTGFLRVFGILNAETIMRRLKLDFSDLYKSGLAYDDLSFKGAVNDGVLTLEEPLSIEGPSGKYRLNGKTNLADKTLAMDMRVELPITQNVPLAALMLGAPQVGGAVWLVDKLLGEPLSSITSATYDVQGTWDNPKVELKETGRK